jgi:S1-C subfamily serine protease
LCVLILLLTTENESALPIHPQKVNADNNTNEPKTANSNPHILSLTNIFRETENSVVQITSQPNVTTHIVGQNGFMGQTATFGSGIVYDLQGHIITNVHVIEGAKRIDVKFADGDTYNANVIGTDSYTDLAVLQIAHNNSSNEMLNPLKLGNSSLLQVGQEVAAIGNPFGIQNLMTEGIIGGLGLLLPSNQSSFLIPDVIVTDVPLNPGNSGGPLLNMTGEVIGINMAITSSNQFSKLSYSMGSNIIKKITPQLITYGRYDHPWLGVTGFTTGPVQERDAVGPQTNYQGVAISSIQPGSPAAKAKLRPLTAKDIGDIIITIDGHAVNRFQDIINYIESDKSVGNTIVLRLLRNGTTFQNINIKLTKWPGLIPVNAEEHNKKITITPTPTLSTLATRNWTNVIRLSNSSSISSQGPRLAASQNNVYAVWEENYRSNINRIMFTKSVNRGDTFSSPINLTSGKIDSETPSISVFGKNVYVVWADNSTGNFDIFLVKSENCGNTFSKPINLSNDPGVSYFPKIESDGNNSIYIVWTENSSGTYNILFAKSIDGRDTFTNPIALDNTNGVSNFPSITTLGNNTVYVVWSHKNNTDFDPFNTTNQTQTYDVFFTRSTDSGDTFSKPINLSNDPSNSQSASIAVSRNDSVYIAWTDNFIGTYEVFFTKSMDGGSTFSKAMVISSNVARALSPSISTYENNIYAVWNDNTFGNPEVFFTLSIDSGLTFSMPININNDSGVSDLEQIAPGDGGDLYLVWQDNITGNNMIYFTKTKTNLPTGSNSSSGRP